MAAEFATPEQIDNKINPEILFRRLQYADGMLVAADLLGVSKAQLIKLLDAGEIPFTKTGRNRRVRFGDVMRFRKKRDNARRERLRELIRQSEASGLYDIEEFNTAAISRTFAPTDAPKENP